MKHLSMTLAGVSLIAMAAAANAQDQIAEGQAVELDEVVVTTPNRNPTDASKVGSKVEVVDNEQIEQKSLPLVVDYLNLLPGVSFTSNGGHGTNSNLYIRGLPGGYVKTLYNGIDVSDTTGIQVAPAYENLMIGGVSRIEVLKGSQGTLYGSNAIAGVVDISTLGEVKDGMTHTIHVEGGSFGTVRGGYGFAGAKDGSKITANVSGFRTDGISAFDSGAERDGYDNVKFDFAAEHRINDTLSLFGSLLYIDAKADFDGFGVDDAYNHSLTEIMAGRAGFNLDLLDGRWKNTFSAQAFKMDRDSVELPLTSTFVGSRQKYEYQSSFEATERVLLQYGADHERQVAETATPDWNNWPPSLVNSETSSTLSGVWGQAVVEPLDNLVLTVGLRHDEHSDFGGHTTYRGTGSHLFDGLGTRLHSSLGTGFRAPSLYQLYDPSFGNADLSPETSMSFDFGVEQKFLEDRLTADLTYFWAEIDDLIGFNNRYVQVPGTTRSHGLEASLQYEVAHWFDLSGSYTYTDSRTASGARSSHVPRHMATISAIVRPAEDWTVSADVKFVSDVVDATGAMDDYTLLNAKIAYQATDSTEIYLRGENLLNENYQVVRGYGTPGIAAYAGIKAKF